MRNPISHNSPASFKIPQLSGLMLLALFTAVSGVPVFAAAPAAPPAPATTHKSAHPHKHPPLSSLAVSSPVAPVLPAPPIPIWPVNETPAHASVSWDIHGLKIDAANSSLHQILDDIATVTGATVEGLGSDQRVFGDFGPGPVRDVLSQLLHGSGYNVLMAGDQGQGTPRQIFLSFPHPGDAAPNGAANPTPDEDAEVPDQATPIPQQPPIRPGFMARGARNPQQLEMQRQQDMQQLMQERRR